MSQVSAKQSRSRDEVCAAAVVGVGRTESRRGDWQVDFSAAMSPRNRDGAAALVIRR